ncbi:unnamed protein product [Leptosia nina]|uniref:Phosphodiesterase n=1 Tax=Leptosia nina TaxID=320188 RepID=A0AAV1JZX3_9NEOP
MSHATSDENSNKDSNGTVKPPRSPLLPTIVINGDVVLLVQQNGEVYIDFLVDDVYLAGHSGQDKNLNKKPPKSPNFDAKITSTYHTDCSYDTGQNKLPPVRPQRRIPKVHRRRKDIADDVKDYLDNNRQYLEEYVMSSIPVDELENWLVKKTCKMMYDENGRSQAVSSKEKFMNILSSLNGVTNEIQVVREIALAVSDSLQANGLKVYKIFPDHPCYIQYFVMDKNRELTHLVRADPDDTKYVLKAAKKRTILQLSRMSDPELFNTAKNILTSKELELNYILYHPILNSSGKTIYVIELWRSTHFDEQDEEMCSNFLIWNSLLLRYCNLYLDKTREYNMSGVLLDVVKSIFEYIESFDLVIKRIIEYAQKLVNADRASLFLIDHAKSELVSPLFDLKYEPGQERNIERSCNEIRMPLDRGIAGHVAGSGETMNIPDAYSDHRFNRDVDELTGYKTVSILCMPLKLEGKIIGVVQMVNKRNNTKFDHEDEVAFETFATFFGLALHHAKLYDKVMRKEQKYKVALEVLSYHNTCKDDEVQKMLNDNEGISIDMNDFYIDPYMFDDFQKCKAVLSMFDDLFDLSNFDRLSMVKFILTVRKNYRNVPYHNFDHGWSVAHAMYVIIKNDQERRFNYKMRLALFVASLCHDLDHRGYTNKYLNQTSSPLAAMYTTSPLEHHHFNITVKILQQDGHYIFSHLSSEEYHDILKYIKHCILATDLSVFFPNLKKMQTILGNGDRCSFDWQEANNSKLAMAISMTAADLSASTKPWDIQNKTVKVIFEEFYEQGDKERAAGKLPEPMMDRNRPEERPVCQVGFLEEICVPCYKILCKILPNTKPMYEMVDKNLSIWKSLKNRVQNEESQMANDDTLAAISDSELDSTDFDDINDVQTAHDPVHDPKGTLTPGESKIKKAFESMRSDSSWDDESVKNIKVSEILKVIPQEELADEEGVVTPLKMY